MKRDHIAPLTRKVIDLTIVLGASVLCFLTAYWLVNNDFILIYGACFIYPAVAALCLSTYWLKNTFVSLSALLFILAIAEVVLSFVEPGELESERKAASYTKGYSQPLRKNGGELGYQPYSKREVQSWKTFSNDRLYDVVYTINEDSYRQTPGFKGGEEAKVPIVFYGGSFAFGEGVNDDETLPYFVAAEINWSLPVVNLAFSGYGPHQMLRSMELGTLRELGYESVGIAIYEAVPNHASRAAGEEWWDPVGPRYVLDKKGTAQYWGRFTDVPDKLINAYYRYLQITKVARRSRVVDWTANLLFGTEASNRRANAHLMVEIVAKSAAILKQDYQAEFVVLFWDDETEDSALILKGLAEKNIRTIKVSDFIQPSELDAYRILNDTHPTAEANKLIAQGLIKRLGDLD